MLNSRGSWTDRETLRHSLCSSDWEDFDNFSIYQTKDFIPGYCPRTRNNLSKTTTTFNRKGENLFNWYLVGLGFFLAGNQLYESQTHGRLMMMMVSKKTIAIFGYKQQLLSLDMKTKVVQHVKSDWMRHWKSVKVWECESVRAWECESVRVTCEHRHENWPFPTVSSRFRPFPGRFRLFPTISRPFPTVSDHPWPALTTSIIITNHFQPFKGLKMRGNEIGR